MKNKNPLISVIVPIYNVEKYLCKCIDSIISQTYNNIEIVLVDDGSTDNSGEMADDYARKDRRIIVIHKENGGLSSARNEGIKRSKGEWLAFVDSDDYIDDNFINSLYNAVCNNNADMATCNLRPFSNDGLHLKKTPHFPHGCLSGTDAVNDMLKNRRPAYIWLSLYRRNLFAKNNISFPDGRNYEDISTKIKLLYSANKVVFIDKNLYYYLMRRDSITGEKFTPKRYDDYMFAINDARECLSKMNRGKGAKYIEYFVLYSLFTLLNYIARDNCKKTDNKRYWKQIRKDIKTAYRKAEFPSLKKKIMYALMIILSSNYAVYSKLYLRLRK